MSIINNLNNICKDVLYNHLLPFLTNSNYVYLTSINKPFKKLRNDNKLSKNYVFDVLKIYNLIFTQNRNVFITGPAGTGKSYIMNKIYALAKKLNRSPCMTAATGIASINLDDGRTLHSFSGLKKGTISVEDLLTKIEEGKLRLPTIWKMCGLLQIDEFSMIGLKFFEKLNIVAKYARGNNRPMGALPLVLSGDFLQLPPVADKFAFESSVWTDLNIEIVELRFPFRQGADRTYYNFLQRIRIGEPTSKDLFFLKERYKYTMYNIAKIESKEIKPTKIMSKQEQVKRINNIEFENIEFPIERTCTATDRIVEKIILPDKSVIYQPSNKITLTQAYESLQNRAEHQAPEIISFKKGAQYILTFNLDIKKKHVNGSRCVYIGNNILKFMDNSEMNLDECLHAFRYCVGNNIYVERNQVALRLGYAITIHSSQGLTLDCALLNLGTSIFASAQAYVALSRIKNSDGLYLEDFVETSIKTHVGAKKFMKSI